MLIVVAYIKVGLEVVQVPVDEFKLSIHEDFRNLETTMHADSFYLVNRNFKVLASALAICSAVMNSMWREMMLMKRIQFTYITSTTSVMSRYLWRVFIGIDMSAHLIFGVFLRGFFASQESKVLPPYFIWVLYVVTIKWTIFHLGIVIYSFNQVSVTKSFYFIFYLPRL